MARTSHTSQGGDANSRGRRGSSAVAPNAVSGTRLTILWVLFALAAILVAGRLVYLSVVAGPENAAKAQDTRMVSIDLPARRGTIYDRSGKVLATIKEHSLPVYEAGAKEFTVEPTRNGSLDICVELINHQRVSNSYDVTAVDSEGPELLKSETLDDGFLLKVSDAGIGVDYRDIYAVSASGETHYPVSADEEGGVLFEYPGEAWDIYIPDHIGNTLHLAVKIN